MFAADARGLSASPSRALFRHHHLRRRRPRPGRCCFLTAPLLSYPVICFYSGRARWFELSRRVALLERDGIQPLPSAVPYTQLVPATLSILVSPS